MEDTHQPATIGGMPLEHFQTFIVDIIKQVVQEVVNPRFEVIGQQLNKIAIRLDKIEIRLDKVESRLDHLETDSIQTMGIIIKLGNSVEELQEGQQRIDGDLEQIKGLLYTNQTRIEHMERDIVRHDRQLEELAV